MGILRYIFTVYYFSINLAILSALTANPAQSAQIFPVSLPAVAAYNAAPYAINHAAPGAVAQAFSHVLPQAFPQDISTLAAGLAGDIPGGHGAAVDAALAQGWPTGCLVEILLASPNQGEWSLILPALAHAVRPAAGTGTAPRTAVLVNPPYVPHYTALAALGLPVEQVLCIHGGADSKNSLWAAEQALRCEHVGAVVLWVEGAAQPALRRLQLAASQGDACFFVLRPARAAQESSPAPLRITLTREGTAMARLHAFKRRGMPAGAPTPVSLLSPALRALLDTPKRIGKPIQAKAATTHHIAAATTHHISAATTDHISAATTDNVAAATAGAARTMQRPAAPALMLVPSAKALVPLPKALVPHPKALVPHPKALVPLPRQAADAIPAPARAPTVMRATTTRTANTVAATTLAWATATTQTTVAQAPATTTARATRAPRLRRLQPATA
jgi:protein ImuA